MATVSTYRKGDERTNAPYNPNVCAEVCPDLQEVSCDLAYDHDGPHRYVVEWPNTDPHRQQ